MALEIVNITNTSVKVNTCAESGGENTDVIKMQAGKPLTQDTEKADKCQCEQDIFCHI